MRILTLLILSCSILLTAAAANALDYWPDAPDGLVYHYSSADFGDMVGEFSVDGSEQTFHFTHAECYGNLVFLATSAAVGLSTQFAMCAGWIDPDFAGFDPVLDLVRDGMADGEGWVITYGSQYVFVTVTEESITVPLGTFTTLHVKFNTVGAPYIFFQDWWLEPSLGPVKVGIWELRAVDGTVATEPSTWSELKALYR